MSTLNVDTIQDKGAAFEHARLVQVVDAVTTSVATGSTTTPNDDTVPTSSEGTEYLTCAITPPHASNKLLIQCNFPFVESATAAHCFLSLFQDSGSAAIACAGNLTQGSTGVIELNLNHYMTAGTTSSTTFKVRIGANSGATTINGHGGARKQGGSASCRITISEIRV